MVRGLLALCAIIGAAAASSLTLVAPVPSALTVTPGGYASGASLSQLNAAMLGLVSQPELPVQAALFSLPKAVVSLELSGMTTMLTADGPQIALTGDQSHGWQHKLEGLIAKQYDAGSWVGVSVAGTQAAGDKQLAAAIESQKVDASKLKSKGDAVVAELTGALKTAAAIKANGAQLAKMVGPASFHVSLAHAGDALPADLTYVLAQLSAAARAAFGDDAVIVELIQWEQTLQRNKREDSGLKPIQTARKQLNVAVFAGNDYPAMFAIVAGLVILLALAILYIAVGLWNMDPGKDSIIYRMTTVRQKKD